MKSEKKFIKISNNRFDSILTIQGFIEFYSTKQDFLDDDYKKYQDQNRLDYFKTKIKLEEPTRIGEVGWQILHSRNPKLLTQEDNKHILYSFLNEGPKLFQGLEDLHPQCGDILFSKPWSGSLIGIDNSNLSQKRGRMNTRFGFGPMDEYGYQYARYDEFLVLKPI